MADAACPKCGSIDPAVRRSYTDALTGLCVTCHLREFHDRPTGADPDDGLTIFTPEEREWIARYRTCDTDTVEFVERLVLLKLTGTEVPHD